MRRLSSVIAALAVCGCYDDAPITQPLEVAQQLALAERRYQVVRLPSLGGTDSRAQAINNGGWVAGVSRTVDGLQRGVLWRDGSVMSLGTLGGLASGVALPGLNDHGMIAGLSHTTELDPLTEAWSCELTAGLPATNPRQACRGFWWDKGVMNELPTLGGTHAFAGSVNGRGQIVGWAETPVHDPTCTDAQILQFRGVLWTPREGTAQELPPFPGDSASAATAINNRGQIVGISGDCDQAVGRFSARRSVLWENGTVIEIPNLGGTTWHTPWAINERGDVVGFSNLPEPVNPGDFNSHAFYWKYGSATVADLGTLDDDPFSQANGINARGQIVGVSHGGSQGARAFLVEDAVMVNLNDLMDLGPDEVFELAADINDAGQIVGRLLDRATGERVAIVATPSGHRR
jgi:probable HAF family extracellular repeat protein